LCDADVFITPSLAHLSLSSPGAHHFSPRTPHPSLTPLTLTPHYFPFLVVNAATTTEDDKAAQEQQLAAARLSAGEMNQEFLKLKQEAITTEHARVAAEARALELEAGRADLAAELAAQQETVATLKGEVRAVAEDLRVQQAALKRSQEHAAGVQTTLTAKELEAARARGAAAQAREGLEAAVRQLEERLQRSEAARVTAEERGAQLLATGSDATAVLQAQLRAQTEAARTLQEERAVLQAQLQAKEREAADLAARLAADSKEHQRQMEVLGQEKAHAVIQLTQRAQELAAAQEDHEATQAQAAAARTSLATMAAGRTLAEAELEAARAGDAELRVQLDGVRAQLRAAEDGLSAATRRGDARNEHLARDAEAQAEHQVCGL